MPNIAAATHTESNCLLPKHLFAKVNNRGAVSFTGKNPNTPAESYTRYVEALTPRLKHSFPVADNPWLMFTQAPTAIQLTIHSILTHIQPDDDEHMFTFIKNSIYNVKEVEIGAARYLDKD